MDDYSALAQRISVSVSGVSSALILSRDGLVLGAYPNEDESLAKPAWLRFTALGEPEKGFVEFADQVWAYVKRGPYAAFATAEVGTRPGVMVDQMEQVLLVVEEGRSRRDSLRVPDAATAPSGKPRTSLHPQAGKPAPSEPAKVAEVAAAATHDQARAGSGGDRPPAVADANDESTAGPSQALVEDAGAAPSTLKAEPQKFAGQDREASVDDEAEVDRVMLAKEFSGLLQLDSDDDERSS